MSDFRNDIEISEWEKVIKEAENEASRPYDPSFDTGYQAELTKVIREFGGHFQENNAAGTLYIIDGPFQYHEVDYDVYPVEWDRHSGNLSRILDVISSDPGVEDAYVDIEEFSNYVENSIESRDLIHPVSDAAEPHNMPVNALGQIQLGIKIDIPVWMKVEGDGYANGFAQGRYNPETGKLLRPRNRHMGQNIASKRVESLLEDENLLQSELTPFA